MGSFGFSQFANNAIKVFLTGCITCGCFVNGTNGTECDAVSGQCNCLSNVVGRTCETCEVISAKKYRLIVD